MIRQGNLTEQSLVAVQRAFVFPRGLAVGLIATTNPNEFAALTQVQWENSGGTPTRDLQIYVNSSLLSALPERYGFPDLDRQGNVTTNPPFVRTLLPPKAVTTSLEVMFPPDAIRVINSNQRQGYLWGWARYSDIFPSRAPHITRFCYVITGFVINATAKTVVMRYGGCEQGNCADQECEAGSQKPR